MILSSFFSRLVADNPERTTAKPPAHIPPANERKPIWFKRRKEDKNKMIVTDSPSKDVNTIDSSGCIAASAAAMGATATTIPTAPASATTVATADTSSDKNACGGSFVETLLISKQTIQEKIRALGLDFFSEDFEGVTASSIQCLACETTT